METICTNKTSILCPFKSTKGMLNGCYDYGGGGPWTVSSPVRFPWALKGLKTPALEHRSSTLVLRDHLSCMF